MLRSLGILALVAALLYLVCAVLLYVFQRSLLYLPHPPSPAPGASMLTLAAAGAELRVTAKPRPGPDAVVYFGGNAEDVNGSLPELAAAYPEHALYLMHYRGTGGSTGKPSESALVADGLALFDRVRPEHRNVVVIGRSLGSGVAVQLAAARPVARLILVTPFSSLAEIAARHYPFFPVRRLMRDKFESWRYAPNVTAPTLLLAAEHDEIVPGQSTEALYARFPAGIATLRTVAGTGHNTIQESPEYLPLLAGAPNPPQP